MLCAVRMAMMMAGLTRAAVEEIATAIEISMTMQEGSIEKLLERFDGDARAGLSGTRGRMGRCCILRWRAVRVPFASIFWTRCPLWR